MTGNRYTSTPPKRTDVAPFQGLQVTGPETRVFVYNAEPLGVGGQNERQSRHHSERVKSSHVDYVFSSLRRQQERCR